LLLLADGFNSENIGTFEQAVCDFSERVKTSGWYGDYGGLCVWSAPLLTPNSGRRLFVCPSVQNPAPPPWTQFEAAYSDSDGTCDYLAGSDSLVLGAVKQIQFPATVTPHKTLVIVNYGLFGGGKQSGSVAWTSLAPGLFESTGLHELGHLLGLSDEYEQPCDDPEGSSGDLCLPNISSSPVMPRWKPLFSPTGLPTYVVKKKSKKPCEASLKPKLRPAVGAWQGGYSTHRRYYRPSENCRMRVVTDDFCAVCTEFLRWRLLPGGSPNPLNGGCA
jgi:hypothetical protein